MNPRTQESLRTETGQAALRAAQERQAVRFRATHPPGPGDVFVVRETAGYPVEWAVVSADPVDARRLLVVPVDSYPQIGSCDVDLRLGTSGRIANVRCDLSTWVDASVFDPQLRTGSLTDEELDRIRTKRDQIESGTVVASIGEEEVDGDPEYTAWKQETLGPALAALPEAKKPVVVTVPPGRPGFESVSRWLALAASVVLVVGLGGYREWRQVRTQLTFQSERAAELEQEKEELERRLSSSGTDVEALQQQHRTLEQRSRQEIRELKQDRDRHRSEAARLQQKLSRTLSSSVDVNLPILRLTGEEARTRGGRPFRLELGPDDRRVALMLEVVDPELYDEYGVRLVEKDGGRVVWSGGGLFDPGSMLRLGLPVSLLTVGEYDVVVYGVSGGVETELEESYVVEVVR